MHAETRRNTWSRAISLIAVGFGALTLREGGAVLFSDGPARAAAGDYVPFVLWFNFIAGFVYIFAGIGLWLQRRWAAWLAVTIVAATALVFAAFGVHIITGNAYEERTIIAMSLRILVWAVIATIAWRHILQARS